MNLYTVLLVDDEESVIEVIKSKINWEEIGFTVIGYANNGARAFEMMEELQADVVMTDIRMPYMDGIELSKKIKGKYPATKILIFTGFDEFEYAKEAIRLEVEDYILKPINSKELTDVFLQMKEKIDHEIEDKRNVQILQKYYMDSLPLLKVNFYSGLIEGKLKEDELIKALHDYQILLKGPLFSTLLIHTSFNNVPNDMNPMLLSTSVQKLAEEYFDCKWNAKCFPHQGKTVVIVELAKENEISELTDECDRFCRYVRRMIEATITIGIGQVCRSCSEIAKSYNSAKEAVSYRAIYGSCRAINIKEIAPQEADGIEVDSEIVLAKLYKAIRLNDSEKIIGAIEHYINNIFIPAKSLQQCEIEVVGLVSGLFRFSNNNDIQINNLLGNIRETCDKILDYDSDELREWLKRVSFFLSDRLNNVRSNSTKSFVDKAKNYVSDNYTDENVSLDTVCENLGVSNSYFSSVFKKETGKSFIGYLTDYRMEKAADMLIRTNEKSYIIAKNVGYLDPNYFSYVFKRQYGVSPSKYRTEHVYGEK